MIEVFATNISQRKDADVILAKIHSAFPGYQANFDLEDCDRILRIHSSETLICPTTITSLIKQLGYEASVLPDAIPDKNYRLVSTIGS